jgi:hypothetical protein
MLEWSMLSVLVAGVRRRKSSTSQVASACPKKFTKTHASTHARTHSEMYVFCRYAREKERERYGEKEMERERVRVRVREKHTQMQLTQQASFLFQLSLESQARFQHASALYTCPPLPTTVLLLLLIYITSALHICPHTTILYTSSHLATPAPVAAGTPPPPPLPPPRA